MGAGIGIAMGGAEGVGIGGVGIRQYFLQMSTPTRKMASAKSIVFQNKSNLLLKNHFYNT